MTSTDEGLSNGKTDESTSTAQNVINNRPFHNSRKCRYTQVLRLSCWVELEIELDVNLNVLMTRFPFSSQILYWSLAEAPGMSTSFLLRDACDYCMFLFSCSRMRECSLEASDKKSIGCVISVDVSLLLHVTDSQRIVHTFTCSHVHMFTRITSDSDNINAY